MNEIKNSPVLDMADLFYSESKTLKNSVEQSLENHEGPSLSKIIELYYQVINVVSLSKVLKQRLEGLKNSEEKTILLKKIKEVEKHIDAKFDSELHILIISALEKSIQNLKKKLHEVSSNQNNKTREDVENQAKRYEKLRKIISTREFVDQYNNGLSNTG